MAGTLSHPKSGKFLGNHFLESHQMEDGKRDSVDDGRRVIWCGNDGAAGFVEKDAVSAVVGADHRDTSGERIGEHGASLFFARGVEQDVCDGEKLLERTSQPQVGNMRWRKTLLFRKVLQFALRGLAADEDVSADGAEAGMKTGQRGE